MRKLSLVLLPLASLLVISLSFYLLASRPVLPRVQAVDAATHKTVIQHRIRLLPTLTPTKIPTPIPIFTPTPTPTSTPIPTKVPTPTPTPKTEKPLVEMQLSSSDSVQSYLMQKINEYRASNGLSSVTTDSTTCGFAKVRAQEITTSFNHDGFTNRINNHTLPYSTYHEITENIAMTSDFKEVVSMWVNSSGHAENMRKDTPYVCVEKSGNYYAYEGWRP